MSIDRFKAYLLSRYVTSEKKADFYLYWVSHFYAYCHKRPEDAVTKWDVDSYLKHLSKSREDWQVKQAGEAIQLYLFYNKRNHSGGNGPKISTNTQWAAVLEDMRNMLRLTHRSHRTEQTYLGWVRRFCQYTKAKAPSSLNSSHVKDFMTHLAVEKKVAPSTQNQAFNAILFLFRYTLDRDIEDIGDAVRAKKKRETAGRSYEG